MQRRTFLSTTATAGLTLSARSASADTPKPGDIPKRVFGKTGEKLTLIGQAGGPLPAVRFRDRQSRHATRL